MLLVAYLDRINAVSIALQIMLKISILQLKGTKAGTIPVLSLFFSEYFKDYCF